MVFSILKTNVYCKILKHLQSFEEALSKQTQFQKDNVSGSADILKPISWQLIKRIMNADLVSLRYI